MVVKAQRVIEQLVKKVTEERTTPLSKISVALYLIAISKLYCLGSHSALCIIVSLL